MTSDNSIHFSATSSISCPLRFEKCPLSGGGARPWKSAARLPFSQVVGRFESKLPTAQIPDGRVMCGVNPLEFRAKRKWIRSVLRSRFLTLFPRSLPASERAHLSSADLLRSCRNEPQRKPARRPSPARGIDRGYRPRLPLTVGQEEIAEFR